MARMRRLLLLAPCAPAPAPAAGLLPVGPAQLRALAAERLAQHGLAIAEPWRQAQALRLAAEGLGLWQDPTGQARLAQGLVEELWRSGADPRPWQEQGPEALRPWARLALAAEARLASTGHLPPALALWRASGLPGPRLSLAWSGFALLQPDELAWLQQLAAPGSEGLLRVGASPAHRLALASAQALAELGWAWEDRRAEGQALPSSEAWQGRVVPGESEAEALAAMLAVQQALAEGIPPEALAVVSPRLAEQEGALRAAAATVGVPLAAPGPRPLGETRPGACLALALAAVESGGEFEATLLALAHPLGLGLAPLGPAQVRAHRPEGWEAWSALGLPVGPLRWPAGPLPWAEWLAQLTALVEALPEPLPVALTPLLQALAGGAGQGPVPLASFLGWVREALGQVQAAAQGPQRGGVALLPLEVLGAGGPWAMVVAVGVQEGAWPRPVHDPPALPLGVRKGWPAGAPRLPQALELVGQAQLEAWQLLAAAPRGLLLRPGLQGKEATRPSPLLAQWGLRETTWHLGQDPAWALAEALEAHPEGAPPEGPEAFRAAWVGLRVEQRREAILPPDGHDGLLGHGVPTEGRSFSATQLLALGQCPFRWFMGFGLGLRAPEEPGGALDPTLRGNLYHKALERAVEQAMAQGLQEAQAFREAVLAALPEAFGLAEEEEGVPAWPGWEAMRQAHLRALRRAVVAPDFLDADARPLGVEVPFEAVWRGLKVKGKLDRADEGPEGLILIDYKTRATLPTGAQDAEGKATLDLQLPIYAEAAAASVGPGRPVADVRYLSLTRGKRLNPPGAAIDEAALAAFAARVHARFAVGAFPPAPDVQGKACGYCDHALACRKGPRLERRRQAGLLDPVAPVLPPSPRPGERRGGGGEA